MEKKTKEGEMFKNVEIVIVNDGSRDKTAELMRGYTEKHGTEGKISVRGVNLVQNQGKGAAVKYVS